MGQDASKKAKEKGSVVDNNNFVIVQVDTLLGHAWAHGRTTGRMLPYMAYLLKRWYMFIWLIY